MSITASPPTLERRLEYLPKHIFTRRQENGERIYDVPEGDGYSVTTVLSGSRDNSELDEWRESVGEERANFISDYGRWRGTVTHSNIEKFLITGKPPVFDNPFLRSYWVSAEPVLKLIEETVLIEGAVWHPAGFAGSLDWLGYLTSSGLQPELLDWKTADAVRNPKKMYEYKLQVAAYVAAANYVYTDLGLNIKRARIYVFMPNAKAQEVIMEEEELKQLFLHFLARMQHFTFARKHKAK